MSEQLPLFEAPPGSTRDQFVDPADREARGFAVDPRHNVVLEASAGTGKTRVLVDRYLNLLRAKVDPANILAITFTRKAAAEMHERIVSRLRDDARESADGRRRWLDLRDRLGEIEVCTIDAFCLSLLREFPLEADVDPGFDVADETEVPRLVELALDRTLRTAVSLAPQRPDLALILAQLGTARARDGLAHLLDRRLVARDALERFLARGPGALTVEVACQRVVAGLREVVGRLPGGIEGFLADGATGHPGYTLFARTLQGLASTAHSDAAAVRVVVERVRDHFLTQDGHPRSARGTHPPYTLKHAPSQEAWRRHRELVAECGPAVRTVLRRFDEDLNVVLARGVRALFAIAEAHYREALDERSVLDFTDLVERALRLLRQMDEFAQSRVRLESRYHHVLVDEFQDTSRAQWELVQRLIQSWGEGFGLVHEAPLAPTIFVVGDRKQSIYRFRDAEVGLLDEAAVFIDTLRPDRRSRRAIRQSLRAAPELLAFVNDVFREITKDSDRSDAFRYDHADEFPIDEPALAERREAEPMLGLAAADSSEHCAAAVADEIARLCRDAAVPDRKTGLQRPVRPSDIAILFRSRVSHREFEAALEARRIPAYVYKGLGFFDSAEIKDLAALMRYLADPASDLRAAALLRSRLIRMSDAGLARLAPGLSAALADSAEPPGAESLSPVDRAVLSQARESFRVWLSLVDRIPPADLLDRVLADSAYALELRGPRRQQAWENVKKLRSLVRRIQNRGYTTLARIADYLDCLHAGDESNAVIEALEAVNLMTVHAAKGLEFPIVFTVNLTKGVGLPPAPLRVVDDAHGEPTVAVARYAPDAEQIEKARDLEETKRLLYVACTRARNRLYLATVLKDGRFTAGTGSLGAVVPPGLARMFEVAGAAPVHDVIVWTSASGRPYRLRVCASHGDSSADVVAARPPGAREPDDFDPIPTEAGRERLAVTSATDAGPDFGGQVDLIQHQAKRLTGTLVHRLLRRAIAPNDAAALRRRAAALVRPDERPGIDDVAGVIASAAAAYEAMVGRDDVRRLLASGECLFEVPFSALGAPDGSTVVRGVIDCLILRPDDSIVVVDFKTGREHPNHRLQLEAYVAAVRHLYPGRQIESVLLYT